MQLDKYTFWLARSLGIVLKPLTLLYLGTCNSNNIEYVTKVFIYLPLLMLIFNFEAHRDYYKVRYQDVSNANRAFALRRYISMLISGVLVLLVPLLVLAKLIFDKHFVVIALVVVLNKVVDEILRSHLFSKNFVSWSKIFITIQATTLGAICVYYNSIYIINTFLLVGPIIGIFIAIFIENQMVKLFHIVRISFREFFSVYTASYLYNHLYILSTTTARNVDRIASTYILSSELSAIYVALSQFAQAIPLTVDFFVISVNRTKFMNKLPVSKLMNSHMIMVIILASILYLSIALVVNLKMSSNFEFSWLLLMLLSSIVLGLMKPLVSISFWTASRKRLFIGEFLLITSSVLVLYFGRFTSISSFLILLLIYLSSRLAFHGYYSISR